MRPSLAQLDRAARGSSCRRKLASIGLFKRKTRPDELHIGDPRFDDWEPVGEYEDLPTARAFAAQLRDLGIPSALTADWPLDEFGRGDIALRVAPEHYGEATVMLDGLEDY